MIRLFAFALALLVPLAALAEEVVAGLSQNRVAITARFDGSEILVFGAIKRDAPVPEDPFEVTVVIAGPSTPITVRRKDNQMGIWVNTDAVQIDAAPSFYAIATSSSFDQTLSDEEDTRNRVSIDRVIREVNVPPGITDPDAFLDALVRLRTQNGIYQFNEYAVQLSEKTLFRTAIALPANLTEGIYRARIFLTRDGEVIDKYETWIDVSKVGLERWLFNLAHEQPFAYGILALVIAVISGWGASEIVRYVRR